MASLTSALTPINSIGNNPVPKHPFSFSMASFAFARWIEHYFRTLRAMAIATGSSDHIRVVSFGMVFPQPLHVTDSTTSVFRK
jgi:hypothetical protein